EQLRIAAGEPLRWRQEDISWTGHAIECRINAEDPRHNFRPSPGVIEMYHMPGGPGIRVDGMAYSGCTISPFYDSMIAKLIAHAPDRESCIARMEAALSEVIIEGIQTNVGFHRALLADERVRRGELSTDLIERLMKEGLLRF